MLEKNGGARMPTKEENCLPFSHRGGKTGILLVHGFTGSPGELRPFGEFFAKRGYSVEIPVLEGHCRTPETLNRTRYVDWVQSAYNSYNDLMWRAQRVFAIGHSMGGLIALYLASRYKVAGVVSNCTPIFLQDWRARIAPVVGLVRPVHRGGEGHPQEIDQYCGGYPETPLRAVGGFNRLLRIVRDDLSTVRVPVLVQQARLDETVRPESARYIHDHLGSEYKQLKWYERSGHMLPVDVDREAVWEDALKFVDSIERGGTG